MTVKVQLGFPSPFYSNVAGSNLARLVKSSDISHPVCTFSIQVRKQKDMNIKKKKQGRVHLQHAIYGLNGYEYYIYTVLSSEN